jgi:hypothetical protein
MALQIATRACISAKIPRSPSKKIINFGPVGPVSSLSDFLATMGFNRNGTKLLLFSKSLGVNFEHTVTIGRQGLHLSADVLSNNLRQYGMGHVNVTDLLGKENGFAEPFLRALGAKTTDSVDASSYENATIIHDMNAPIADVHKKKYDVVIDGGSLEHIFNFPVAVRNCMEMVKPGGYFIGITPANNYLGHGFYQFSPELYFRVFSPENGFKMEKLLFYNDNKNAHWYEVKDPNEVKSRVILSNRLPSNLFVLAKKISDVTPFTQTPQQSDYQHLMWEGKGNVNQIEKNQRPISVFTKLKLKLSQVSAMFRQTGDANKDFFKKL